VIVPTSNLFKLAYGKYAIGAYNINNMEQTLGLFKGSIESQSPFIIQLSKGARKYADKGMLEVIIRKAEELFPEAVFAGIWPKTLFMPQWPAKQEWPWDAGMDIMCMCQSALLFQDASRSIPKGISGIR
jgi:Fructose-bisphosphate aldolase class-II